MISVGSIQRFLFSPQVPVIRITGLINKNATENVALCLKKINTNLSQALAVVVNSPGGSPCQSQFIVEKLRDFSVNNQLTLYTFAQDIAASGGYFILASGDKVYCDPNSIVGSIGALSLHTNVKSILQKYKIQRWRFTSSEKEFNHRYDQFSSLKQEDQAQLQKVGDLVHKNFINHVESFRDSRIKVKKEDRNKMIYNAEIFLGQDAVNLGLVDGLGTLEDVLYQDFPKAKPLNITAQNFMTEISQQLSNAKIAISTSKSGENQIFSK